MHWRHATIRVLATLVLTAAWQPAAAQDNEKSPYDFDQLSAIIDADQVDYFSGQWSYTLPLTAVQGGGSMTLPIQLRYSSAVTGLDRLIKLSAGSKGTHTVNQVGWVGLGWNLNFGAIVVNGGYNTSTNGYTHQHPYAFDMSLVLPDGAHTLVHQLDENNQPTGAFYLGRRKFWQITMHYDGDYPLASTWEARNPSGTLYRFGAQPVAAGAVYGYNVTTESALPMVAGTLPSVSTQMAEFVYQWLIAEIVDPSGNYIRFYYEPDDPVTTYRSTQEEFIPPNVFRNFLMVEDLDPFTDPASVGDIEVIKTFHTAHLKEIRFFDQTGALLRTVETVVSNRTDIPVSTITVDSLRTLEAEQDLAAYNHLRNDILRTPAYFRSLDGLSTATTLNRLVVRNGDGSQIARFDFAYSAVPAPSPADAASTYDLLVLDSIAIEGKPFMPGLPAYRFEYSADDSYRLSKMTMPTGGTVSIEYEPYPPVAPAFLTLGDGFFERARRIKRRIIDPDNDPETLQEITEYRYPVMDVWRLDTSNLVTGLLFPVVDEILPGNHGKIRHGFIGKADLLAMGYADSLSVWGKINREIRRGLPLSDIALDESGQEVRRTDRAWSISPEGSYIGYEWFASHGVRAQSFWIRPDSVITSNDGVRLVSTYGYNTANGLVNRERVGDLITRTAYVGDAESSPVPFYWVSTAVDRKRTYNDVAYGTSGLDVWASAAGTAAGGIYPESEIRVTFGSSPWTASTRLYRVSGTVGVDSLSATAIYTGGEITVDVVWSNGSRETVRFFQTSNVPGLASVPFTGLAVVPEHSGMLTGRLEVSINAYVYKPVQSTPRYIRMTASDLRVEGIDFAEYTDPEYPLMVNGHILTAPKSVRIIEKNELNGIENNLRYTEYRYGDFAGKYLPDTTFVWLDRNRDGEMLDDAEERVVQAVVRGYDASGHPVETADPVGVITTTVRGYRGMTPVAAFANTTADSVAVFVFDEHLSYNAMKTDDPGWTDTGNGPVSLANGTLVMNDIQVRRTIPALSAGVFEFDVMMDRDTGDQGDIRLMAGASPVIAWRFASDGQMYASTGGSMIAVGLSFRQNQWFHIRIAWSDGGWFAVVDGARHPASGTYTAGLGTPGAFEFANTNGTGALWVDRIRVYPASARPLTMVTADRINLSVVETTDPNGVTAYLERDGLGRVVRARDAARRVVSQRHAYFSRESVWHNDAYLASDPNQDGVFAYPDPAGYLDALMGEDLIIQTSQPITGVETESALTIITGAAYEIGSGGNVTLTGRDDIVLKPGFHARAGAEFLAVIDPAMPGGSSGDVTYNNPVDGELAVRLGAPGTLEIGEASGHVVARVDVYPTIGITGTPDVLCFEDGAHRFALQFAPGGDGGVFQVQRIHNAGVPAVIPLANLSAYTYRWYTAELELRPDGTCTAWVYPRDGHRRPDNAFTESGYPAGWRPQTRSLNYGGALYLANVYLGRAEQALTFFDGAARSVQTQMRTAGDAILTHTEYNALGRPVSVIGPVDGNGAGGDYVSNPVANGKITAYAYTADPLARTLLVIPPGHNETSAIRSHYGNDGLPEPMIRFVSTTDEKGYITTQRYNKYGRMIYSEADSAGITARTGFKYDLLNQLEYTTAPEGDRTHYFYDTIGRLTGKWMPDMDDTIRFKYDLNGRMRFVQDARQKLSGLVSYTVYDAYGRTTRSGEAAADFATLDPEVPYGAYGFETDATTWATRRYYDVDYFGAGVNYALGRQTRIEENTDGDSDAEVTVLAAYDREGRIARQQVAIDGLPARTVRYEYDLSGRVRRIIYPDHSEARYVYDSAGRIEQVTDKSGGPFAAYTYTSAGRIATHVVGDSIVTGHYAYNLRDWVTGIDYAGKFQSMLGYDAVGNVTSQMYRHDDGALYHSAAYGYDRLHRLISFNLTDYSAGDPPIYTPVGAQSFAYDRNGNMVSRTTNGNTVTYTYTGTPNRVTGTSEGASYGYDANGAITAYGGKTLAYDYRGLVVGYSDASQTYTYLIDSDGKRVKKTRDGDTSATVYYVRGADGAVLAEYDGTQALDRIYVYAGSQRIAYIKNDTTTYYLADHLGNSRAVLTEYGAIPARYDYWPYGEILWQSGDATRFKFTGHERDDESRLDYMLARMYDPALGRFLQPDPHASNYPGWSPYVYGGNNPLIFTDPTGREWKDLSEEQRRVFQTYVDNYNKQNHTELASEEVYNTLNQSQMATFESITYAMEHTQLVDNQGNNMDNALKQVAGVTSIVGERPGTPGDQQFRIFADLKPGAIETFGKAQGFEASSNKVLGLFQVYHKGFPRSFRQIRREGVKGMEAGLQPSYNSNNRRADIDIDYRFGAAHLKPANSDVRAPGNYQKFIDRWPGLRNWWDK